MAILVDEITQALRLVIERRDSTAITRFASLLTTWFAVREETMSTSEGATRGELAVLSDRLSELIGAVREGFAQMERRFEDINQRFEDINQRFEDQNKRFSQLMWLVGILFGSLHIVIILSGFGGIRLKYRQDC